MFQTWSNSAYTDSIMRHTVLFSLFLLTHSLDSNDSAMQAFYFDCFPGWTKIERKSHSICVKVFAGSLTWNDAQSECKMNYGALMGIDSLNELQIVSELAAKAIQSLGRKNGGIWLGAKRKEFCIGNNATLDACKPYKTASFYWTDLMTTGIAGFNFPRNQPDNIGNNQNCVYVYAGEPATDQFQLNSPTEMDDAACDYVYNSKINDARSIMGFACAYRAP
ncbi:unnamed protein product [Caenorhabditis bovis]|uniref:C-type lectin domain-containing protein n=1 Tax=Caenorhabditis bovis TaxID=2654633 RepID=A0A8S1ESY2_9PELO|nr:unnamed protein product [Caenorhabditis bovis]